MEEMKKKRIYSYLKDGQVVCVNEDGKIIDKQDKENNDGAITERTVNFFERQQKDIKETSENLRKAREHFKWYEKRTWENMGAKYANERYTIEATGEELFNITNCMNKINCERDIRGDENLERLFELVEMLVNRNISIS